MMRIVALIIIIACWCQSSVAQPGIDTARFEIDGVEVLYRSEKRDVNNILISEIERLESYSFYLSGWVFMRSVYNDTGSIVIKPGDKPTTIRFVFNSDTTRIRYLFMDRLETHPRGMLVEHLDLSDVPVTHTATRVIVNLDSADLAASDLSYRFDDGYVSGNGESDHWSKRSTGKIFSNGRLFFSYLKDKPSSSVTLIKAEGVHVSSNPARSAFDVFFVDRGMQQVALYDQLGREVYRESAAERTRIDVSGLIPGLYFLAVGNSLLKVVIE